MHEFATADLRVSVISCDGFIVDKYMLFWFEGHVGMRGIDGSNRGFIGAGAGATVYCAAADPAKAAVRSKSQIPALLFVWFSYFTR
jgi:hypothetical protein